MGETTDVAVVGAGQAGLTISYLLTQAGIEHLVLERGRVGESWRSQRWDSFFLNTPSWFSGLLGKELLPDDPKGFGSREQLVDYFERYVDEFGLPVRQHTVVTGLDRLASGEYEVSTESSPIRAKAVVVASGSMSRPRLPDMAQHLPKDIVSLSSGTYRNPDGLPGGAVLVVGSAQSGCQIVEELLRAGREVYLCASRVGRAPRTYRGRDIFEWWRDMGFVEQRPEDLDDPAMQYMAQPQVSGTGGGHTVSLQSLARDGAVLLGRAEGVEGSLLKLGDNLLECIAFGDFLSGSIKKRVDEYIERAGIVAEPPSPDPGEPPLPDLNGSDTRTTLDLREKGITSVIWCTGFDADWSWIHVDVFDDRGEPNHRAGVTDSPGLYVVGFPWLTKRKSGVLYGVAEDAERIVGHIEGYLGRNGGSAS